MSSNLVTLASGPALFRSETVACGRLCCGAIGIERAIIFGLILRSRRRLVAYRSRLKAALSGSQERWRASAYGGRTDELNSLPRAADKPTFTLWDLVAKRAASPATGHHGAHHDAARRTGGDTLLRSKLLLLVPQGRQQATCNLLLATLLRPGPSTALGRELHFCHR